MDELMPLAAAAQILDVEPESIRSRYCRFGDYHGAVPVKSLTRRIFLRRADVEKILRGERINAASVSS